MQSSNGIHAHEVSPIHEIRKYIPARLIRLFLFVATLKKGRHIIVLSIGDDTIDWDHGELGKNRTP